ncbi:MAG: ABC transporter ATP-binding protein/permease [Pseudomonadales bacterium]|nr:ABC transporter ATP-binding protein/permease [Pseudomonadales bacterium]
MSDTSNTDPIAVNNAPRKDNLDQKTSESTTAAGPWKIIRRVLPYLWPAGNISIKRRVVLSMTVLVLAKLVAVATPFFYKTVVDLLSADQESATWLLAIGTMGLTVAYGVARLMNVLFQELRDVIFSKVGQRALRALALQTITHIHQLSMRYHISRKTGGLSRIIERGVKGIAFLLRFLLFNIGPLLLELSMIAVILVIMFDLWYLLVVSVTVISYITFTTRVTQWRLKIRKKMNDHDRDANQKAIDGMLNFETVKYFNAQGVEAHRYDQSMAGYEQAALKTLRSLALLNLGQAVIINSGLVAALALAAYDVAQGNLTVGGFVMVNAYMMQVMMPLGFLGFFYREIRQALLDMAEMFELLEQPAEIVDKPDAPALKVNGGKIQFRSVNFFYQRERQVLKGLDLCVEAGQTVAIVGSSGSGKSTIGRLLFRFYDVTEGALLIDGQDVRDVTQLSLQRSIGVVPQDTVLFNDSIYYNISYGKEGASREEVEAAAKAAKIHDFILQLPDGYDTTVGERGLKLSGGEKQRVGIARTMLKNAPILLLDEATSALDTQTEREIQQSLQQMGRGRTVITIAHRLSTVVDANLIVVLEQGLIVEQGTHQQLLDAAGRYSKMWQSQLQSESHPSES